MTKIIALLFTLLVAGILFADAQVVKYPISKKGDQLDHYFGTTVADPYRWLENDTAADVIAWVDSENTVTFNYLKSIPFREKIRKRLTEIYNFPKYSAAFINGENIFYNYNDGLRNQSQVIMQNEVTKKETIFLDPNKLSKEGTATTTIDAFSKNHRYCTYHVNRAGSDWETTYVLDVASGKNTGDSLKWLKFGGAAWQGNGFYYSGYDAPSGGTELLAKNEYQKVFYHKMGQPQSADRLIYQDKEHPLRYISAATTEDEQFLIIYISEGTDGSELWYKDLSKDELDFRLLFKGFSKNYGILDDVNGKFLVQTNDGAENYHVVLVDPESPDKKNWKEIIAEKPERASFYATAGGKLFGGYLKDAITHVYQYTYEGKLDNEIKMPGLGTATGFSGLREDKEVFYDFTSYTMPNTVFRYSIASGKSEIFKKSDLKVNTEDYITEQVFYYSKDGTKIPMFLTHKKDLKQDGSHLTLLYGYGGFDVSSTPAFSISNYILLENGGIFAVANLRGGGEYGDKWHDAGKLLNKQNVFDDFIAAAEYLKKNNYTTKSKLAIMGRSNGGLLVGACETQRPDLFGVCFPAVGVMDMLRFQKFTVGWGWVNDYGSSDSAKYFKYLYGYSPYHNIKNGVNYPPTLITTADHDDRVVPGHSFKFAARLQEAQSGNNPVLIRIDKQAGHGAGKPLSKTIDEQTDIWSFMFWNMGIRELYN
ncbi:MAG: S9 family peptidase [Chitinophagales bacterium]|nr:S9 family peptidase [Chitinophagales bacterium]